MSDVSRKAGRRDQPFLRCLPSEDAVQRRLNAVLAEAKQLRVLLRTARELQLQSEAMGKEGEADA